MKFNCTVCGLCCMQVGWVLQVAFSEKADKLPQYVRDAIDDFPYRPDLKGVCIMLDKVTYKCKVFDNRPDLCNMDKLYERFPELREKYPTMEDWYKKCMKDCNDLMKLAEWPKKYRIKKPWIDK